MLEPAPESRREEQELAARLIERLLTDASFRATFRRNPGKACRDAGLDQLGQEMSLGAGKAMMTLDVRESKSSLAGVVMAAAMEGVAVYEFTKHVAPGLEDLADDVAGVLSHVNLPAVQGIFGGGGGAPAAAPVVPEPEGEDAVGGAAAGGAAAAAPAPAASPEAAAAGQAPPKPEPDSGAKEPAGGKAKAAGLPEPDPDADLPSSTDLPEPDPDADLPSPETATPEAAAAQVASGVSAPTPDAAPAPPAAVEPSGGGAVEQTAAPSGGYDPDAYGLEAPGVGLTPEAEALLDNPKVHFDETGIADLKAGKLDPRVIASLTALSEDHEITVSSTVSDHPKLSSSGSVSNHAYGRGVDIATIDGEIVRPNSPAARELAAALSELPPEIRPNEVGTPFAINQPGFFTDAGHQDHIHYAWDDPIAADWKPPAGMVGAAGAPAAAAVASPEAVAAGVAPSVGAPGAALAGAAPPAAAAEDSFLSPKAGAAAAQGDGDKVASEDAFLKPKEPVAATAAAAQAQPAAAAPVAAAAEALTVGATPGGYPGDDAPKEDIALWMAKRAEAAGLPPELPVMAGLVESNMSNLDYGDASSEGYFQMLTTIWDKGKYQGFQKDPEKQIQWFIDTAGPLKSRFGSLPHTAENLGTWVADTERPAEQYRGRYAERFEEARALIEKGKAKAAAGGGGAVSAAPVPEAQAAPAAAVPEPSPGPGSAGGVAPDPDQYGMAGGGGEVSPEARAVLANDRITLDANGREDFEKGRMDPRVAAAILKLAEKHTITVSSTTSDHPEFTASGGSQSNHWFGRGIDIATVDGEVVRPDSPAARELAAAIAELDPSMRPSEVGSPFQIGSPGFFTDAGHQDHIHFAFDDPITSDWKAPAAVSTGAAGAAAVPAVASPEAVAAGVAPAAPGAPVQPPVAAEDSFLAPEAGAAATGDAADGVVATEDSFLQPPAGPARALAQDPSTVPAAVADAAAARASGGSTLGASALEVANREFAKDVREVGGANRGTDVEKYLASAGVAPGNPWCASFVTWAFEQSGRKMEGGGWAAVQTWVRAAEQGTNDLEIVSPEDARPGDLVAYDWGGQDDFGSDGHIGFLASEVKGGQFTALEGNWQDALLKVPRRLEGQTNVVFLRMGGDAPAAPAVAPATPDVPEVAEPAVAPVVDAAVTDGYPGDDAPKEAIAAWMAGEAKKRGLPPELPLMASLVESGMRNLNYGDADSVGFFQMRVGIWDRGDYAGYPEDPQLQVKWFLDQAEAAKKQRIARGLPVDDPDQYGEWVADVERPAEQYRGRYQTKLGEATNLLKQAGAAQSPPTAPSPPAAPEAAAAAAAERPDQKAGGEQAVASEDAFLAPEAKGASASQKAAGSASFLKAVTPDMAKAHAAGASPEEIAAGQASLEPPGSAAAAAAAVPPADAAPLTPVDLADVPPDYPGDGASQAELAKWLAKEAEKAGLPPELPVMAALVESGVKNLNFGDADSVGFFQMRVGIWNKGDYAGYPENPGLQAKWFIDQALAVKRQQIAQGNTQFGKDPSKWGEWIADVERPAEQYRGRYQLRLAEARKLLDG